MKTVESNLHELTESELLNTDGGFLETLLGAYLGTAIYYIMTDPQGVLNGMLKCL